MTKVTIELDEGRLVSALAEALMDTIVNHDRGQIMAAVTERVAKHVLEGGLVDLEEVNKQIRTELHTRRRQPDDRMLSLVEATLEREIRSLSTEEVQRYVRDTLIERFRKTATVGSEP